MTKNKTNWKTIAIIFIVIAIAELLFIAYIFSLGTQMYENEETCAYEICGDQIYDAYTYDEYTEMCYCWEGDEISIERKVR